MKKTLKTFLILSIVFVMLFPNFAVIAANVGPITISNNYLAGGSAEENSNTKGKVEIIMNLRLPTKRTFHVTLQKQNDNNLIYSTEEIAWDDNHEFYKAIYYTFSNLEPATYELTIKGDQYGEYLEYKDSIVLKAGEKIEIDITNGHDLENVVEEKDKVKEGVIGFGDINKDGTIDQNDETKMIEVIESNKYEAIYDLNGDSTVDIIDLSYITINKDKENILGTQLHHLNTDVIDLTANEQKVEIAHGSINAILENNDEYVSLQPTKSGDISSDNAVEITMDMSKNETVTEGFVIAPSSNQDNNIKDGIIEIEYSEQLSDGSISKDEKRAKYNIATGAIIENVNVRLASSSEIMPINDNKYVSIQGDGSIVLDLKGKIAIKKVTITVTQTGSNKLADISKVEFLNDMDQRIPPPELSIPTNVKGIPGSKEFSVTWDKQVNVTGYEVSITKIVDGNADVKADLRKVEVNSINVTSYCNDKIKNGEKFSVMVRSINGEWKSDFSAPITVIPTPAGAPPAPDNVKVVGAYKSLKVSWKDMEDTENYDLYYRVKDQGDYIKAVGYYVGTSYTIENLEDNTRYQVYVIGRNEKFGIGPKSIIAEGTTANLQPAVMPKYKLINTSNGTGKLTNNIKNVTFYKANERSMVGSQFETDGNTTAFGIVDDDYSSYFLVNDWDVGGENVGLKTPTVEFNNYYTMSYFAFAQVENLDSFTRANIIYWDREGKQQSVKPSEVVMKKDANGRDYTVIKLAEPIMTNKINIGVGRPYGNPRKITIAEMCFYEDVSIERDVRNLFADSMRFTLKEGVTLARINKLRAWLNDPANMSNGEYYPEKDNLLKELDWAEQIYNATNNKDLVIIDTSVTEAKDGHITFRAGLNAWQPLGIVAHEGETVTLYVGNPKMAEGADTNLKLIVTQYHAEASAWYKEVQNLKIGKNEITIPAASTLGVERGGSVYINYTGNNSSDRYYVRVDGGHRIPMLDLTKIKLADYNNDESAFEAARKAAVKKYVEELVEYVPTIESLHASDHLNGDAAVNYDFAEENCILGATEIVLDQMMYSVSAKMILEGLGEGNIDTKTTKLYNSLVAMEDMVDLFYSHKGLYKGTASEVGALNVYPVSRLNIRYQRMFAGAFMYAGGKHIGIEYASVSGLSNGEPIEFVAGKDGKYKSGNYFGWGIAHEIGHIINEGAYAIAEVTNNYFSVLAQAQETNESVRFDYQNVYDKVTSGTLGRASNVFTQLGLYWQLHLAYDNGYNYKTYTTYKEQFDNLIFARMDTYARELAKSKESASAPAPDGIKLSYTEADLDNKLMRLACAAAEKDLLEFFERWGMQPNFETRRYASQFEKETRPIYYINDEARLYKLEGNDGMQDGIKVKATLDYEDGSNQVKITLSNTDNTDAMLGYEIIRSYMDNDQEISRAVAFVTADEKEYIDTINTINNRVFTYKVRAVDKCLNVTPIYELEPVKIHHDGSIAKDKWDIETNLESVNDKWADIEPSASGDKVENKNVNTSITTSAGKNSYCEPEKVKDILKIADNYYTNEYTGMVSKGNGEIIISIGELTSIVALKYKGDAIGSYEIQVSTDKANWETVKTGTINTEGTSTIYFDKENDDKFYIYDAAYVKFIIKNATHDININEIDLLSKTGDDVELFESGIGILKEDYVYQEEDENHEEGKIPAGSLIFTGKYKGNPAYNAVKLYGKYDEKAEKDTIIKGYGLFFADEPEEGANLGETSNGIWIYVIEPENVEPVLYKLGIEVEDIKLGFNGDVQLGNQYSENADVHIGSEYNEDEDVDVSDYNEVDIGADAYSMSDDVNEASAEETTEGTIERDAEETAETTAERDTETTTEVKTNKITNTISIPVNIKKIPTSVRVELYRVDDPLTNEGERLVSDYYRVKVPSELNYITINSGN